MKDINYEQARNVISDGDIVFVRDGESVWSKLTQKVTSSDVYHCGIAFWVRDPLYKSRLFMVEAHRGGRRIVSLSSYAKHPMYIFNAPASWEKHCDPILDNTGVIPYSYIEYVWIGLLELFRIRRNQDDFGEVCSKMVANYCKEAGLELETDISPGRLKNILLELGCTLKCSITLIPNAD